MTTRWSCADRHRTDRPPQRQLVLGDPPLRVVQCCAPPGSASRITCASTPSPGSVGLTPRPRRGRAPGRCRADGGDGKQRRNSTSRPWARRVSSTTTSNRPPAVIATCSADGWQATSISVTRASGRARAITRASVSSPRCHHGHLGVATASSRAAPRVRRKRLGSAGPPPPERPRRVDHPNAAHGSSSVRAASSSPPIGKAARHRHAKGRSRIASAAPPRGDEERPSMDGTDVFAVEPVASYASSAADDVRLVLHLPQVPPVGGPATLRLRTGSGSSVPGHASPRWPTGALVEASVPPPGSGRAPGGCPCGRCRHPAGPAAGPAGDRSTAAGRAGHRPRRQHADAGAGPARTTGHPTCWADRLPGVAGRDQGRGHRALKPLPDQQAARLRGVLAKAARRTPLRS